MLYCRIVEPWSPGHQLPEMLGVFHGQALDAVKYSSARLLTVSQGGLLSRSKDLNSRQN